MNKNILRLVTFQLIFMTVLWCSDNNISFVNISIGNSISLGNELSVVDNGVFNSMTNPAMLGKMNSITSVEYNRLFYYADTYYDLLGLCGTNVSQGIVSGIVLGRFSSGNIAIRDIEGELTGENIEYSITTANIGLASRWGKYFWLGFSGYGLWEKSNIDSRFFGGNIGGIYNFNIRNRILKHIRLGAVVRGVGLNDNLVHNEGVMLKLFNHSFYFGFESNIKTKNNDKFNFGIDLSLIKHRDSFINLRLGISALNNELLRSYGTGFGLRYKDFILDYSMNMHNFLGMVHNIKLGYFFGEPSSDDYIIAAQRKEQRIIKEQKDRKISIAVSNFSGKNISTTITSVITDMFISELMKIKKYVVLDKTKKTTTLFINDYKYSSCGEISCAVEIGKILRVEQVVFGVVAEVKGMYYVTINFVDVNSSKIVKSESVGSRDLSQFPKLFKEMLRKISQE